MWNSPHRVKKVKSMQMFGGGEAIRCGDRAGRLAQLDAAAIERGVVAAPEVPLVSAVLASEKVASLGEERTRADLPRHAGTHDDRRDGLFFWRCRIE